MHFVSESSHKDRDANYFVETNKKRNGKTTGEKTSKELLKHFYLEHSCNVIKHAVVIRTSCSKMMVSSFLSKYPAVPLTSHYSKIYLIQENLFLFLIIDFDKISGKLQQSLQDTLFLFLFTFFNSAEGKV